MSAIDNAFIRAYTLDTAASPAGTSDAARPLGPTAGQWPDADRAPILTIAQPRPANSASAIARARTKDMPPALVATIHRPADPVVPAPHIRLSSFLHTTTTLESAVSIGDARTATLEPRGLQDASAEMSHGSPFGSEPAALPSDVRGEQTAADPSLAALEVDQFVWPEICDSLFADRSAEIEQLAILLGNESSAGRKVIAITGSRRGEGRSTSAMLVARQLSARKVRTVLVDADFEAPQLAARLGMAVENGWETTLADGSDLADCLIESIADRLAILPLAPRQGMHAAKPPAAEFAALHQQAIESHLETLAKHFDVVIVDAGIVKANRADGKPRGALALAKSFDAAIMLSDARLASPSRVADLQRRLLDADVVPLGLVENFCQSKRT